MDSKLQVFNQTFDYDDSESLSSNIKKETVNQIQIDSVTDWSCWCDAGWANGEDGCIIQ